MQLKKIKLAYLKVNLYVSFNYLRKKFYYLHISYL